MDAGRFQGVRRTVVRAGNHWRPPVDLSKKGTGVLPAIHTVVKQESGAWMSKKGPQELLPGFRTASLRVPYAMLALVEVTLRAIQAKVKGKET